MITETTRGEALIAAANGRTAFVITQKDGYPDIVNLTKLLSETLTEKGNIFIADIDVPEPEPEPETPPLKVKPRVLPARRVPNAKGKKSKLDDGKIAALFNAGWSYEKIAEEMGTHPNTIYKHLASMRAEGKI